MTDLRTEAPAVDQAEAVVEAVLAVPGVLAMHSGAYGEVATYLPGRQVTGVRIRPGVTDVHVVATEQADLITTAADVRRVVQSLVGTPVDVYVEDIA